MQPLNGRWEGVVKSVRRFCLRKRGSAAKLKFTRRLALFINEDVTDRARAVMGHATTAVRGEFSHSEEGWTAGVPANVRMAA